MTLDAQHRDARTSKRAIKIVQLRENVVKGAVQVSGMLKEKPLAHSVGNASQAQKAAGCHLSPTRQTDAEMPLRDFREAGPGRRAALKGEVFESTISAGVMIEGPAIDPCAPGGAAAWMRHVAESRRAHIASEREPCPAWARERACLYCAARGLEGWNDTAWCRYGCGERMKRGHFEPVPWNGVIGMIGDVVRADDGKLYCLGHGPLGRWLRWMEVLLLAANLADSPGSARGRRPKLTDLGYFDPEAP